MTELNQTQSQSSQQHSEPSQASTDSQGHDSELAHGPVKSLESQAPEAQNSQTAPLVRLEDTASYQHWQRWWWGQKWLGPWPWGGFSTALFSFLKRFRIRRLAKNFEWLTNNLETIPDSQLEEIGPYWYDFAQNLGQRSEAFGRALGRDAARFGTGLSQHSRNFALGLNTQAARFARGLGGHAPEFIDGLGEDGQVPFFQALDAQAGAFIGALEDPEALFERFREPLLALTTQLGEGIYEFAYQLGSHRLAWFESLGPEGQRQLVLALGTQAASLIKASEPLGQSSGTWTGAWAEAWLNVIKDCASDFTAVLGHRCDDFMATLGPLRSRFVLFMGAEIAPFIRHATQPGSIFIVIAEHPSEFAASLGERADEFGRVINERHVLFFSIVQAHALKQLLAGLGSEMGRFMKTLVDPKPVFLVFIEQAEALLNTFGNEELERLAQDLSPHALQFGTVLRPQAESFARALGSRAPAFGRGLSRHARAFVLGLGGEDTRPPERHWFPALFVKVHDYLQGNHYTLGFLKGLSPELRMEWFEAIHQKLTLRLQARNRLRCSLCHQELQLQEALIQCPSCATVVHKECLTELSRSQCPHDLEPMRNFIDTSLEQSGESSIP